MSELHPRVVAIPNIESDAGSDILLVNLGTQTVPFYSLFDLGTKTEFQSTWAYAKAQGYTIRALFISHFHADHIGDLASLCADDVSNLTFIVTPQEDHPVLSGLEKKKVVSIEGDGSLFSKLLEKHCGTGLRDMVQNSLIVYGSAYVYLNDPTPKKAKKKAPLIEGFQAGPDSSLLHLFPDNLLAHKNCLIFQLRKAETTLLLTGDSTFDNVYNVPKTSTIVQLPHHGSHRNLISSKTRSLATIVQNLLALNSEQFYVSNGRNSITRETMKALVLLAKERPLTIYYRVDPTTDFPETSNIRWIKLTPFDNEF